MKEQEDSTESLSNILIIIIMSVVIILFSIIPIVCVININMPNSEDYTNELKAVYKGYYVSDNFYYPIVEIEGKEYVAKTSQRVRDISYIGEEITIKYIDENFNDFLIQW